MAVPATLAIGGPYVGNDIQTEFPFPFKIFASTDVDVWINDGTTSAVISTSLYTVDFSESVVGGTVILNDPLTDTYRLSVVRNVVYEQTTVLNRGKAFLPEVVEQMDDELTFQTQALDQRIKQEVTFDPTIEDADTLYTQLNNSVIAAQDAEDGAEAAEDGAETAQAAAELAETNAAASAAEAEAAIKYILPQWDATHTYGDNEQVAGTDGLLYVSTQATNLNHNPIGDGGTWWFEYNIDSDNVVVTKVWGSVDTDGSILQSGSGNWSVSRNSLGNYQLNITDAGNYLVYVQTSTLNLTQTSENTVLTGVTGIFTNNTASNIIFWRGDNDAYTDIKWLFHTIKL